jgi:hypothetical protein
MTDNENAAMAPQPEPSHTPLQSFGVQQHPPLLFDGPRRPLFWLLLRNFLLTIVTLGIYRFWAKTRVRKFFWQRTKLLDEPLEYLGTGGELFVGFLIAIVVLVPFGAVYSLLQFLMVGMEGALPIIIQVVYYTIIAFLIPVAIYRMRRYRLTRTAWRGVRFGLDGSALRYAVISFAYTVPRKSMAPCRDAEIFRPECPIWWDQPVPLGEGDVAVSPLADRRPSGSTCNRALRCPELAGPWRDPGAGR